MKAINNPTIVLVLEIVIVIKIFGLCDGDIGHHLFREILGAAATTRHLVPVGIPSTGRNMVVSYWVRTATAVKTIADPSPTHAVVAVGISPPVEKQLPMSIDALHIFRLAVSAAQQTLPTLNPRQQETRKPNQKSTCYSSHCQEVITSK